jgi:hypothetical protein
MSRAGSAANTPQKPICRLARTRDDFARLRGARGRPPPWAATRDYAIQLQGRRPSASIGAASVVTHASVKRGEHLAAGRAWREPRSHRLGRGGAACGEERRHVQRPPDREVFRHRVRHLRLEHLTVRVAGGTRAGQPIPAMRPERSCSRRGRPPGSRHGRGRTRWLGEAACRRDRRRALAPPQLRAGAQQAGLHEAGVRRPFSQDCWRSARRRRPARRGTSRARSG